MTDESKQDLLSDLSDKTRRAVMKSVSIGVTGMGVGIANPVAAAEESGTSSNYDELVYPGRRNLQHNVALTNNTSGERDVLLQIHRQTTGETDPVVFERSYKVSAPDDTTDNFPNVIHDSESVKMQSPGFFTAAVKTGSGRSASVDFYHPTGRIRAHESVSIRLNPSDLKIDLQKA